MDRLTGKALILKSPDGLGGHGGSSKRPVPFSSLRTLFTGRHEAAGVSHHRGHCAALTVLRR